MSLYRYLPTPSDRMAIIWSLLSVDGSIVLEYGPAGTTHFSMGLYGSLGVEVNNRLFTTHMSEDDVVMGDVTRLEEAIIELDAGYNPKVIFVVASSTSAVIGTDIKGVCNYMQNEVKCRLIPFEQGGFRGDYSNGVELAYKFLVKHLPKECEKVPDTYNIIGASMGRYRMASDIWEIDNLLKETFGLKMHACLCSKTSMDAIEKMGCAQINIVLSVEGVSAAEMLKEKFGTPYIYTAPYGYQATLHFLKDVSAALGKMPAMQVMARIGGKMRNIGMMQMYAMMGGMKNKPQAVVKGDYDQIIGFTAFLESVGFEVQHKVCSHSLKNIANPAEGVEFYPAEKDWLNIFKPLKKTLVLADDTALMQCDNSNTKVRVSAPVINGSTVATHLPFMGEKGADYLLEYIDLYYQNLR